MKEEKELFKIIKCYLYDKEYVSSLEIDEEALYRLARKHFLSNFLINWSKNCQNEKLRKLTEDDYYRQIMRDTNENLELENMLNEFEKAEVETLVVKGITMKEVYPKNYMRPMCDIDIMIHEKDFKKAYSIMKNLGYEVDYDTEKHLLFEKKPFTIVEVHHKLVSRKDDISANYFNNEIWSLCVPYQNYKSIYRMNLEDTYLFCIIHLIHHCKYAGMDIKDILDVYLFNEKYKDKLKWDIVNEKLQEFEALEFEHNIKKIAYRWFGDNELDHFDEIEEFILKGESYQNLLNYAVSENKGRGNYTLRLFFPNLEVMQAKYPVLKKVPALLPVMWGVRIVYDIVSKEVPIRERFSRLRLIQGVEENDVEKIENIYQKLGVIRKKD